MLNYLALALASASLPEQLAGRYTRLLLSYNPEIGISYNTTLKSFKKTRIENDYSSIIKIGKEKELFTLKTQGSYICENNSKVQLCSKPSEYNFEEMPFGYRIIYSYKCLTAGYSLSFKDCDEKDKNQIFVFDLDKSLYCKEPTKVYEDEDNDKYDNSTKKQLTYAQKKKILEKEIAQKKIKDPSTISLLKKLYYPKMQRWPYNWC